MREQIAYAGGHVVGKLDNGVFTQRITQRHIFGRLNAKGLDVSLYRQLQDRCLVWRLVWKGTGRVMEIDFERIAEVGFEFDTGAGKQIMVKLEHFTETQGELQGKLI